MQLMSVILGQLYAENTCGAMSMCIRESLTTAKNVSSISSATYNFYIYMKIRTSDSIKNRMTARTLRGHAAMRKK